MSNPRHPDTPAPMHAIPVDYDPFAVSDSVVELPLTDAQREIWAVVQMGMAGSCAYNMCSSVILQGGVSIEAITQAIQRVFDRHDSLRARFDVSGEKQYIEPPRPLHVPVLDLSDFPQEARESQIAKLYADLNQTPFDLVAGPCAKAQIIIEARDRTQVTFSAHHIVFDGVSAGIFLSEFVDFYNAECRGETARLKPALQFEQHVASEQTLEYRRQTEDAHKYWVSVFSTVPPHLTLPTDKPRPPVKTFNVARVVHTISSVTIQQVAEAAGSRRSTAVAFLLAAFQVLLSRISGQNDLVVGLPISVRDPKNGEAMMGHAVNLLPIRAQIERTMKFSDILQTTRTRLLEAQEHQTMTFGTLVRHLNLPRDLSRTPLVTTVFNMDRRRGAPDFCQCSAEVVTPPRQYGNFELELQVGDSGLNYRLECTFNSDLFDTKTIERWLGHYENLVSNVVDNLDVQVRAISLLGQAELEILRQWNATEIDYPRDVSLVRLVEIQVSKSPEATAVICENQSITYCELNARANQLAHALRSRGVRRGQLVGLCLERSVDMLAAVLAVLKAGAAYVPLDPMFPEERLRYMAEDACVAQLVSTSAMAELFGLPRERQLLLDADVPALACELDTPLPPDSERDARSGDPAYVIYTSGSTGKPKGVVVPHRAVVNFLNSMSRVPGFAADDVLVAVTTLSFDIAVLELQLPLTVGGTVVIASRDEPTDGDALIALVERHGATLLQATPVTWRLMLAAGWTPRGPFKALVGGEALPRDLADQLIECGVELWNMYGPTETTVWSTCARIADTTSGITIGTPIDNTTVYVLDTDKNLCPIGVAGELWIGGDGVTLGYWNQAELTADRFIADPFSTSESAKLYRTGDRARWRHDGMLEHLGRLDFQIKIRGYRIELGEIEAALLRYPGIHQAVVHLIPAAAGEDRLAGYLVMSDGQHDVPPEIVEHLRKFLPSYMIPAAYVVLEKLPLTPNGKIDRKALPVPSSLQVVSAMKHREPETEVAQHLASEMSNLLGVTRIGLDDDFFSIGGHSMLALRLVQRIRDIWGVEIPMRVVFTSSTLGALSDFVEGAILVGKSTGVGSAHESSDREEFLL